MIFTHSKQGLHNISDNCQGYAVLKVASNNASPILNKSKNRMDGWLSKRKKHKLKNLSTIIIFYCEI